MSTWNLASNETRYQLYFEINVVTAHGQLERRARASAVHSPALYLNKIFCCWHRLQVFLSEAKGVPWWDHASVCWRWQAREKKPNKSQVEYPTICARHREPVSLTIFYQITHLMKIATTIVYRRMIRSQQHFAHSKTAQLSWNVQNSIVIILNFDRNIKKNVFINFEIEWNFVSRMGATQTLPYGLLICGMVHSIVVEDTVVLLPWAITISLQISYVYRVQSVT